MTRLRLALGVLTVTLLAVPCTAEVFVVTLHNGAVFQSRYQPAEAAWDPGYVIFLDELGTPVAIAKEDIESVSSETENSGFGTVLDSTTIDLGFLPNDMPTEEEVQAGDERSALDRLIEQQQLYQPPSYDQQQFVEPSATGGGIPVGNVPLQGGGMQVIELPGRGGGGSQ